MKVTPQTNPESRQIIPHRQKQEPPPHPKSRHRSSIYSWPLGSFLQLAVILFVSARGFAATPYVMAGGAYFEGFDNISGWTDGFASGTGAAPWGSVATNAAGTIPDGVRTTVSTSSFSSGQSGGVQKGTGAIILLSTGSSDNTSADAIDLFLDFTGVGAGTLSFDWTAVGNSTGNRASSLRIYASTDGSAWTELGAAAVLNLSNNVAASGSISQVPLPASFTNSATARIRFYEYNGTGGTTGSRAKIAIDNLAVTAAGPLTHPMVTSNPPSRTNLASTTATFTVTGSGGGLYYQWFKDTTALFDIGNISGSGAPTLVLTNVLAADAAAYSVVITNSVGSATSSVARLTVIDPAITTQPVSRTSVAGDTANFFIVAAGTPSITHQWLFNGASIGGATAASLNVYNIQAANAGAYTVVVTNGLGSAATSSVANLALLATPANRLARWDFNATNILSVTSPAPSSGTGSASLLNGLTSSFASGTYSDPTGTPGAANSGWNTTGYPSQGTANKSSGVQFNVSTAGQKDILLAWEERHSNTASKYARLQYSTNGSAFTDGPVITMNATDNSYVFYYASLAGVPGVSDNPNFAFRIVSEFESTAINTANNNYVGTVSSYSTAGTMRFDLVTVFGNPLSAITPVPLSYHRVGTNIILTWNDPAFSLATSAVVTGAFSKVPGAASPYTNPAVGAKKFFRLVYP